MTEETITVRLTKDELRMAVQAVGEAQMKDDSAGMVKRAAVWKSLLEKLNQAS